MTDFNPNDYYKDGDNEFGQKRYSLLEPGIYLMIITQSELKQTAKGDGSYLKMTMQVCDGTAKTCIFPTFNISNPNQQCVEIGRKQLAGLCKALGLTTPDLKNPKTFEGHKILAEVYIKKGKGDYQGTPNPDTNQISAYQNKDAKSNQLTAEQDAQEAGTPDNFENVDNIPF